MATKTVYILSKIGWEYNDETYYRPESEGGTPVKAYSTKEKAQAECDKLNAPLLKYNPQDGYCRNARQDEEEQEDEYGCVPITEDYEVVPVTLED
jgi:hypothetical protein